MRGVLFPSLLCLAICLHYATAQWNEDVLSEGKTCEDLCQNVSNCNPLDEFNACKCFPRHNVNSWLHYHYLPIDPRVVCMLTSDGAPKCCDTYKGQTGSFKNRESEMASKISDQSQEIDQLTQSLSNLKADMLKKLGEQDKKVGSLTQDWSSEPWKPFATELIEKSVTVSANIGFTAYLGSAAHVGSYAPVRYNMMITNDGGGYNPHTGYFTCHEAGTYLFSFSLTTYNQVDARVRLVVSNVGVVDAYVYPSGRYMMSSNTAIVKVSKGDVVCVQLAYDATKYITPVSRECVFTGLLVHV